MSLFRRVLQVSLSGLWAWRHRPRVSVVPHANRALLAEHGIALGMSRSGDCNDNAVVWSFFDHLKQELANHVRWNDLAQARAAIHDYIFVGYNRRRLHSTLGYRTLAEDDQGSGAVDVETCQQVMSLFPLDPHLPGAPPPDRRAALELRKAPLRVAPPKDGSARPSVSTTLSPVCTRLGEALLGRFYPKSPGSG